MGPKLIARHRIERHRALAAPVRTRLRSLGLKPETVAIDAGLSVHEVAAILNAWEEDLRRGEVGTGAAHFGRLIIPAEERHHPAGCIAPAPQRLQTGGVRRHHPGVRGFSNSRPAPLQARVC